MRQFSKYLRQIFIEDISVSLLLFGLSLTVVSWTIGVFFWGIDLYLLPIMLGIWTLMISGPGFLLAYLRRKNKDGAREAKNLGRLKSFVLGTYFGLLLLNPIDNWDERQRQKSGLIISESLEGYKIREGQYPTELSEVKNNLAELPITYALDKFSYHLKGNDDYDLDIPIPIMDRWHWDRGSRVFVYDDF